LHPANNHPHIIARRPPPPGKRNAKMPPKNYTYQKAYRFSRRTVYQVAARPANCPICKQPLAADEPVHLHTATVIFNIQSSALKFGAAQSRVVYEFALHPACGTNAIAELSKFLESPDFTAKAEQKIEAYIAEENYHG